MTPTRFMVIAGEPSGDMLGAELVSELRAGFARRQTYSTDLQPLRSDLAPRFFGAGGPRMAEAGVELAEDMTRHSVVGITDVLKNIFKLGRILNRLVALAKEQEPHVIVCVDYSGFNRRFATKIKTYVRARRGPFKNWNPKIIQYVSPQVWASREGRIWKMARSFDRLLTIFPFEKNWYATRVPDFPVEFVGHPIIDRHGHVTRRASDFAESDVPLAPSILLLPGSRRSELERHLPVMIEAFLAMRAVIPAAQATVITPSESLATMARFTARALPANGMLTVQIGGLGDALSRADLAIASTGTVTMECAYFGVPTVTMYKVSWPTYEFGRRLATVNSLTMPNILAKETVFPEFLQDDATPDKVFRAALELLCDKVRRQKVRVKLAEIIATLGGPGASRRAADAVLKMVP